jgi:membrane protein DedA with SNARE-associated domain
VVGSAHIPRLRFFTLNLIGAIVWAIIFAYVGYGLGEAASQLFIDDFKRYGLYLLGGLMFVGFVIWLITLIRHRRQAKEHGLNKHGKIRTRRTRP